MILADAVIAVVAALIAVWGLVFLLFPRSVSWLEKKLNAVWGERDVLNLRLGVRGERAAEKILNKEIQGRSVHWDGWAYLRPRVTGAVLCLAAGLLWLLAVV